MDRIMVKSSKRALVLHVGLPKTGSTALQFWCHKNRAFLADRGISYPAPSENEFAPKHQFVVKALRTGDFSAVEAAIAEQEHTTLFLSTEGIGNYIYTFPQEHLEAFRSLFANYRVTILLMLRDRQKWITSIWKQSVVNPGAVADTRDVYARNTGIQRLIDYDALQVDLKTRLAADDLRAAYLEDGWMPPLLDLLGVDPATAPAEDSRENESISDDLCAVIRQVNGLGLPALQRQHVLAVLQMVSQTNHNILMDYARDHGTRLHARMVEKALRSIVPETDRQEEIRDKGLALSLDIQARRKTST